MNLRKILTFLGLFCIQIWLVHANLSISPLKYEIDANPGDTKQEVIKVTNDSANPVTLYTSKEDFIAWDDSGTPTFVKSKDKANDAFSLSNWIQLENGNITLAKNETREIKVTINVPKDWEPGWHYWAIFFSPGAPGWAQITVVQRLWVLLLINVSWDVKVWGNLSEFKIGTLVDKAFTEKNDFDNFPIVFDIKFQNVWNVHIKPAWKITITDENWEQLKNIWKEAIISPNWAFIWEKLVNYIPVNDSLWNVLPQSSRKFESLWEGFWYQELQENGTKLAKFKDLDSYYSDSRASKQTYLNFWETVKTKKVKKTLTAALDLSYVWTNKENKDFHQTKNIVVSFTEQYVWINNWMILVWVLLLSAIWYYSLVIAPKSKEKLKAQLLEELRKN
ncbi:MAG: hypothetical protein ACD_2C00105G0001 [uncultured bacterium (gcode 4)]|uniref:WxL Interacting Protein peptidoglycan binding domain-containing protein n=1 Tax=uncultured bacterium (gcode 4) TaxID=1234023 RepID=K2GH57_9BACT|nr:MAG: hypothetical protein ACD_2C00105G0001 [uncultured bacterium (gcode 4)]